MSPTIPNPYGSSVDASRVVRADYAHAAYAKLAAAAVQCWRSTEWGQEGRYTENGLLFVCPNNASSAEQYVRMCYENVMRMEDEKEKVQDLPTRADVEKVLSRYRAETTNNIIRGYVNWGSGWSDAEAGVRFARKKLEDTGKVVFKTGNVERILFLGESGQRDVDSSRPLREVKGVLLSDGTIINAGLTILATGAWTPQLVDLRGIAQATGQVITYIRITDDEQQRLKDMPTILNFATGVAFMAPRNNLFKVSRSSYGYRNPKQLSIPAANVDSREAMEISIPEVGLQVPPEGQRACREALKELFPWLADRPFHKTRICWYTDTFVFPALRKGDFLITHHPDHPNLFLATGGSGHGYKFLPVLGDKIVDAIEGKLEPELQELWKWPNLIENEERIEFDGTDDGGRSGRKGMILARL
ncbi:FAD dependent oxidoreductase [Elaphomyces granulatus]